VADRQDSDREVLTSLPRSRPVRRSSKRAARPDAANGAGAKSKKAAAKPRAKAAPKPAAKAGAKPAARRAPKAGPRAVAPDPVAPRRKIPPAGYAAPTSRAPEDPASASADLIGTAVQAAGELAQIGFAVGRQTLKSMLDRLPRP
jgi:hypothetical protein